MNDDNDNRRQFREATKEFIGYTTREPDMCRNCSNYKPEQIEEEDTVGLVDKHYCTINPLVRIEVLPTACCDYHSACDVDPSQNAPDTDDIWREK